MDVGCGSGELTYKIHKIVSQIGPNGKNGKVIGIDKSENMIKAAKSSQEQSAPTTPQFFVCDGQELQSWLKQSNNQGKFDKVFSNAALHWMNRDPVAVVHGMFDALKSGGTLAVE